MSIWAIRFALVALTTLWLTGCSRTYHFGADELVRGLRERGRDAAFEASLAGSAAISPGAGDRTAPRKALELVEEGGKPIRLSPAGRLRVVTLDGESEVRTHEVRLEGDILVLGEARVAPSSIRDIIYRRRRMLGAEIGIILGTIAFLGTAAFAVWLGQTL